LPRRLAAFRSRRYAAPAMNRKAHHGKPCPYCKRQMNLQDARLTPTRDHAVPKSMGGRSIVICCWQCNNIKANMMPDVWAAYMLAHPGWWMASKGERRRVMAALRVRARLSRIGPRRVPVIVPPELVYAKPIPMAESMFILAHGKKAYRAAVLDGAFDADHRQDEDHG
jgi:hypothetical protein